MVFIIGRSKYKNIDFNGNHLHYLHYVLRKKSECIFFEIDELSLRSLLTFFKYFCDLKKVLIYPNSIRALMFGVLLALLSKKVFAITWRMERPAGFIPKLKYAAEYYLLSKMQCVFIIAKQQKNSIAKRSKNIRYLPPIVKRAKKVRSFNNNTLWAPGGADRNETMFIALVNSEYDIGIRSTSNLRLLERLSEKYRDNKNIICGNFDLKTWDKKYDIFLIIENFDNPAGLTTLFENLHIGQRFVLSNHLVLDGMNLEGKAHIICDEVIINVKSKFDNCIDELVGAKC